MEKYLSIKELRKVKIMKSGKQSRQRRKDAVNRARADVYANKASPYSNNPFTDQRQARHITTECHRA